MYSFLYYIKKLGIQKARIQIISLSLRNSSSILMCLPISRLGVRKNTSQT